MFALALILHIVIRDVAKPNIEITQAPWQANQQIGQRYLYSPENAENILVGSSLTFHLDLAGTKDSITNLSFSGESAYKGIDLAVAKGKTSGVYPKKIFIEINTLDHYSRSTFDKIIYNPFLLYPRKFIPALRDGKQPLAWVATILQKHILHYFIPNRYTLFESYLKYEPNDREREEAKKAFVPNERLNISKLSPQAKLGIENKLVKDINLLIENGCEPIFFEMPVSDKHRLTKKYETIRAIIERNYPAKRYSYIGYSLDSNYQTYDGLHLSASDNPRYSAYLRASIDSISCLQTTK